MKIVDGFECWFTGIGYAARRRGGPDISFGVEPDIALSRARRFPGRHRPRKQFDALGMPETVREGNNRVFMLSDSDREVQS